METRRKTSKHFLSATPGLVEYLLTCLLLRQRLLGSTPSYLHQPSVPGYPPTCPSPLPRRTLCHLRASPRDYHRPELLSQNPFDPSCEEHERSEAPCCLAICVPTVKTRGDTASEGSLRFWAKGLGVPCLDKLRTFYSDLNMLINVVGYGRSGARGVVCQARRSVPSSEWKHPAMGSMGVHASCMPWHHRLRRRPLHRTKTPGLSRMGNSRRRSAKRRLRHSNSEKYPYPRCRHAQPGWLYRLRLSSRGMDDLGRGTTIRA